MCIRDRLITDKRTEFYDYCVISSHPPETLRILKSADFETKELLSKFKFQKNEAVLHLDESILPEKKIAWASWNYLSTKSIDGNDSVSVSYLINKLQPLPFKKSVIVTLNPRCNIDNKKIIKKISYKHTMFST